MYLLLKLYLVYEKSKPEISELFMISFSTVTRLLKVLNLKNLYLFKDRMPFKCFHRFIESINSYIKLYLIYQKASFDVKEL